MSRSRARVASVLAALLGGCASLADDPPGRCEDAARHLEECLGVTIEAPAGCASEDADQVLGASCEELEAMASAKADGPCGLARSWADSCLEVPPQPGDCGLIKPGIFDPSCDGPKFYVLSRLVNFLDGVPAAGRTMRLMFDSLRIGDDVVTGPSGQFGWSRVAAGPAWVYGVYAIDWAGRSIICGSVSSERLAPPSYALWEIGGTSYCQEVW